VKSPRLSLSILTFLLASAPQGAWAQAALDPALIPQFDVNALVPPAVSSMLVKTLGILTNHRSYQGAESLGNPGIDLGLEATLVRLPSGFAQSLEDAGMAQASSFELGALPAIKVHAHKGLGPKVDVGFSAFWLMGNFFGGGAVKFLLVDPEEGLRWSFRIGYSVTSVDLSRWGLKLANLEVFGIEVATVGLKLSNSTLSPQVVASRRISFAEPYIGAGLDHTWGKVDVPITITIADGYDQNPSTGISTATQLSLFTGLVIRPPQMGLKIAVEGSWGSLGMHTIGAWAGLGF